jgi:hypothetical protein
MEPTNIDDRVRKMELELVSHEVQCEERWKTNFARLVEIERQLSRMESTIRAGGATTILFLAGIVISLLM